MLWSLEVSKNRPLRLMHIICRFVKSSSYNMHQCLRCILGHLQWSQSLYIILANPRLAMIELHTKWQLFILSVSRYNWSWLQRFWPRLNWFNPKWANPPICLPVFRNERPRDPQPPIRTHSDFSPESRAELVPPQKHSTSRARILWQTTSKLQDFWRGSRTLRCSPSLENWPRPSSLRLQREL